MKEIYLDNSATTKVAPEVLEAMLPFFQEEYGNPSSMHLVGARVGKKLQEAREHVADLIGCQASEIVFTSCGTESDNAVLWSALRSQAEKKHIVTSRVEHPAINNNIVFLRSLGYRVTEIGVDNEGLLNLDEFKKVLTPETALATFLWANNETGVLFPIEEMAEICKYKNIQFCTDAVQAVGKIPINLEKTEINFLAFSGHKLHAPKGIGVLYIKKGTRFTPFMVGGHQENGRRGGTENVPYIIGLGKAAQMAKSHLKDMDTTVKALRNKLEDTLLKIIPNSILNGSKEKRLPNITNISFEYIEGESILLHLSNLGICASSGSACTSGSLEPSHVLRNMGVPFTAAHGSIRFSFSVYNTEQEVDYVIKHLPSIVQKLRDMSPFWKDGAPKPNPMITCATGNCSVCD